MNLTEGSAPRSCCVPPLLFSSALNGVGECGTVVLEDQEVEDGPLEAVVKVASSTPCAHHIHISGLPRKSYHLHLYLTHASLLYHSICIVISLSLLYSR